nr:hypothetical protein GCM10020185_25500 [Pseudomonas brassicacearum subsp. brassicacearum]
MISLMGWGLGYFGQPHILARFMAADSVKSIANARRISMTWMILCLGGTVAVGFFGIAYFSAHPDVAGPVTENPERVFIELAKILFNPWVAGVLLSAILAAVMSTLSCQLLVCSSALTEDFYKTFLRKGASQLELVWVGRAMVLLVALIAIALAANPEKPCTGPGELRLGRFRCRLRPGCPDLRDLEEHDPQWRARRHPGGCNHRDCLEAFRLAGPVRNHPGLHLRQPGHLHCQQDGLAYRGYAAALRRGGKKDFRLNQ